LKRPWIVIAIILFLTLPAMAQSNNDKNMDILKNIVAAWRLEESSGTRFDYVGNYDLTDNNTVGVATGKVGNAALFVLANSESLSIASDATHGLSANISGLPLDWTITGWVYLNSKLTTQAITSKWDAASGALKDYLLQYNHATDRFEFLINNGSEIKTASADSLGAVSTGTWYLLIAWYDSAEDTVNIKVNAKAVDSVASATGINASATDFYIGREATSGTPHFLNGRVDAVHIWRKVLTPAERKFLYNFGNGREFPFGFSALKNLVAAYKFEESSGDRADSTGRGNNLTNESGVTRGAGIINYGAAFDGTNHYLSSFNKADLQIDGDFTLALWFYPTGSGARPLVNKRDFDHFEYWMYIDGDDIFLGMGTDETVVTTDGVILNDWNFVLISYHAGTNEVHLQLNNGDDLSGIAGGLGLVGDADFELGQAVTWLDDRFEGRMDALNIWKRILSKTERSNLFNDGDGLEYPFGGLEFQLNVDWGNTGLYSADGDDVSDDVKPESGIGGNRGKDQIRILAPPKAGDFSCELNNQNRDYSIENTESPLFDSLEPGRRVRLRATHAMQTFPVWAGVVDDLPQHPEFGRRTVDLVCLGNLSKLTEKKVSTALYTNIRTDEALGYLLDAMGWPAADRAFQFGQTILLWYWLDDADPFAAMVELLNTEGLGAAIYEDSQGRIVFENRNSRFVEERSTVSQFSYGTTENIKALGYNRGQKNVINKCSLDVITRTLQEQSVVWSYGSTLTLAPGEVKQIQAKASDPFSNAQIPSPTSGTNEIQMITLIGVPTNGNVKFGYKEQFTAEMTYTASAAAIQAALEGLSTIGAGNVSCTGGNLNASPVFVEFKGALAQQDVELLVAYGDFSKQSSAAGAITAASADTTAASLTTVTTLRTEFNKAVTDLGNIQTVLNGLTQRVSNLHAAFGIYVDVDTEGVAPDYSIVVGGVDSIVLDRTSGAYVTITITAGASGATITGLQLRAQLATITSTIQVMNTIDASDSIEKYGEHSYKPQIRSEIDLDTGQSQCNGIVYLYKDPRSTVSLQILAFNDELINQLLSSEISDRITIADAWTGFDADFYIEQSAFEIIPFNVLQTTFGCEKAIDVPFAILDDAIVGTSVVGF
jgi:hypothetical protein